MEAAGDLVGLLRPEPDVEVMIAPPFPALYPVKQILNGKLCPDGGTECILGGTKGHSRVRSLLKCLFQPAAAMSLSATRKDARYFNETDSNINKKLSAAFLNNLTPILCVGETEEARENNNTFSVLDKQMEMGLLGLSAESLQTLVLAYEPVVGDWHR